MFVHLSFIVNYFQETLVQPYLNPGTGIGTGLGNIQFNDNDSSLLMTIRNFLQV